MLDTLKPYVDRWNILRTIAAITALVLTYVIGEEHGTLIGFLVAALIAAIYTSTTITSEANKANKLVLETLSTSKYQDSETRKSVISKVLSAQRLSQLYIVSLTVILVFAAFAAGYPTVTRLISKKVPSTLEFESLSFFDPTRDQTLLLEAPYLEAVIRSLKAEGEGEARKTNIIIGLTKPFLHPTPSFPVTLLFDSAAQEVTGYAFRAEKRHNKRSIEPIMVTYPANGQIGFMFPECDQGDQMLFVGRISLTDQNGKFHSTVLNSFTLQASPRKAHQ